MIGAGRKQTIKNKLERNKSNSKTKLDRNKMNEQTNNQ